MELLKNVRVIASVLYFRIRHGSPRAVERHDEFGDVNVYMRLLLHTLQKVDRPRFAESLAILLGETGTLYQIELSLRAIDYFRTLPGDTPSGLPRLVHKVVRSGAAAPKGFDPRERPLVYPDDRWQVLAEGQDVEINTVPLSHGREGNIPASYLILRQRASRAA